ncbi:uncharacterized protein [Atheta coriaria]|uniref:uncharacterized protein isoform X7 n=1 Tax=Dalotia coriaria TaxID=877792 RepID=UPI0031F3378D
MAAENTLVFDFAGERHTEGQPFFHQIVAGERHAEGQPCFYQIVAGERHAEGQPFLHQIVAGERHAGGQPFFHQIRANAMPEDNRSFTKLDFAPDSNIVEGPFLQQIVIIKFHYLK